MQDTQVRSLVWEYPTLLITTKPVCHNYWVCALEPRSFNCCYCCCCIALVVSDSVRPHRRQPTRLPVSEILQARTLEWVAISFSNAWKWKVKVKSLSRVRLFETPWTTAYQAPSSMGFSRQEYWSRMSLPSPEPQLLKSKYTRACAPQQEKTPQE